MKILPLGDTHDRQGFDCGNPDLNAWLQQIAGQHQRKKLSRTYVAVTSEANPQILGYYCLAVTELLNQAASDVLLKRLPGRTPAYRLGRLTVARSHQGQKIGQLLLGDALDKAGSLSEAAGGIFMVVDAKPEAVEFYRRYGFEQLQDHPSQLVIRL